MYILAFSLDWFTTIPGILITLGVVLLIVAIILFATGNKKEQGVVNNNIQVREEVTTNNVEPVQSSVVNPVVEPVNVQSPVEPKFESIPIGTPGVDPINPVESVVSTNDVATPVENSIEIDMPEVKLDQTMVSVYGGENPVNTVENSIELEPKVTTIYGGNDPLEATQSLPKVEEHHEPYGGAMNEVKIVEPIEESVIEIPEMESITAAPIEIETPAVEQKEISFEIPTAPVEIPDNTNVEIPTVVSDTLSANEEKKNVEEL